jgi:hypothetical protein
MVDIEQALHLALLVTPSEFQCIRMNLARTEIFLRAALQLSLMIMATVHLSVNRPAPRTILATLSHPDNHLLL